MRTRRVVELVAVFLMFVLSGGCSTMGSMSDKLTGKTPEPKYPPFVRGVLPVANDSSIGHVCPTLPTRAWTAAHVVQNDKTGRLYPLITEIGGKPVTLMPYDRDSRRDLAWVAIADPDVEFEQYYEVSEVLPVKGDKVWIVGYDIDKGNAPEIVEATVLNVVGTSLYYDDTPGPGSSGSCVLNEAGEVVGINTATWYWYDRQELKTMGYGHLIAGSWATIVSGDDPFDQQPEFSFSELFSTE